MIVYNFHFSVKEKSCNKNSAVSESVLKEVSTRETDSSCNQSSDYCSSTSCTEAGCHAAREEKTAIYGEISSSNTGNGLQFKKIKTYVYGRHRNYKVEEKKFIHVIDH